MKHLTPPDHDEWFVIAHDAGAPREEWMIAFYQDQADAFAAGEDYCEDARNSGVQPIVYVLKLEMKA